MELIADYIESVRFDVEVNVVSSFSQWRQVVEEHPVWSLLLRELREPCNRRWLASRLKKLATEDIDPQFAHPKDTAMAIYVWALSNCHSYTYKMVLEDLVEDTPNTWYLKKIFYWRYPPDDQPTSTDGP